MKVLVEAALPNPAGILTVTVAPLARLPTFVIVMVMVFVPATVVVMPPTVVLVGGTSNEGDKVRVTERSTPVPVTTVVAVLTLLVRTVSAVVVVIVLVPLTVPAAGIT